MTGRQTARNR